MLKKAYPQMLKYGIKLEKVYRSGIVVQLIFEVGGLGDTASNA